MKLWLSCLMNHVFYCAVSTVVASGLTTYTHPQTIYLKLTKQSLPRVQLFPCSWTFNHITRSSLSHETVDIGLRFGLKVPVKIPGAHGVFIESMLLLENQSKNHSKKWQQIGICLCHHHTWYDQVKTGPHLKIYLNWNWYRNSTFFDTHLSTYFEKCKCSSTRSPLSTPHLLTKEGEVLNCSVLSELKLLPKNFEIQSKIGKILKIKSYLFKQ